MVNLRITNSELKIRDPEGNYVLIESPAPRNVAFENGANQANVPLLFNGDGVSVRELHPGEELRLEFVTVFPEMEDETAIFNLVSRSFSTNLNGSNISIPTYVGPNLGDIPTGGNTFDNWVEFATGFLEQSVESLEGNPKFSDVISNLNQIRETAEALFELVEAIYEADLTEVELSEILGDAIDIAYVFRNRHKFMNIGNLAPEEAREFGRRSSKAVQQAIIVVSFTYKVAGKKALQALTQKVEVAKAAKNQGPRLFSVDPSMKAKDIELEVLVNGSYIKNPTAQNLKDLIRPGSNYVGNSQMNGQFMYVVVKSGNIIIGTRAGMHMPHPTLIGGNNPTVQGAGIIDIRGGKIFSIDNASGHFKPDTSSLINVENAFNQLPSSIFHRNFQGFLPHSG